MAADTRLCLEKKKREDGGRGLQQTPDMATAVNSYSIDEGGGMNVALSCLYTARVSDNAPHTSIM